MNLEIILYGQAVLLLIFCLYTDIKEGKIKNAAVITGFLTAALGTILIKDISSFLTGLKMCGFVFLLSFPVYLFKGIGAGDVKLLVTLALMIPDLIIEVYVASFFVAALISVFKIGKKVIRKEKLLLKEETIKFTIPISAAFICVLLLNLSGLNLL